jgi:hypothetical protein
MATILTAVARAARDLSEAAAGGPAGPLALETGQAAEDDTVFVCYANEM